MRRNPHQQRHYRRLYDITAGASDKVFAYLSGLSDKDLANAARMVDGLSTSNCAATIYYAREMLKEAIRSEQWRRTSRAKP